MGLHDEEPRRRIGLAALVMPAVIVSAVHPICCDDLWWQLSRGRAVVEGSLTPAQTLLAGDVGPEADWLGGVLFYFAFGWFGLSGLMAVKIAAALLVTLIVCGLFPGHGFRVPALCMVMLVAARAAWEPTSVLVDAVGLAATFVAVRSWVTRAATIRMVLLLLIVALWGNTGSRSALAVIIVVSELLFADRTVLKKTVATAAVVAACCATPAGLRTLSNSAVVLFPGVVEDSAVLSLSGWSAWYDQLLQVEHVAFAGLTMLVILQIALFCRTNVRLYFGLVAAHVLAAAAPGNVAVAAIWMTLVAVSTDHVRKPAVDADLKSWLPRSYNGIAAVTAVIALVQAVGPWHQSCSGMGWGIDPHVQDEPFSASVRTLRMTGNAHCPGIREAGLLAWHRQSGVKPLDTPVTALLNNRLRQHVLLTSDFAGGWQTPHRRPDGIWGGWWLTAKQLNVSMLVVPSEHEALIRALEPSIWKPVSLNAVSLVYGRAGDQGCTSQIVRTLALRHLTDRAEWQYVPASPGVHSHFEFRELFDDSVPPCEGLRLARVFRAMRLHIAALRVLGTLGSDSHPAVRREFFENQLELGFDERLRSGRCSQLRLRACQAVADSRALQDRIRAVLNPETQETVADDRLPVQVLRKYVAGNGAGAIDDLTVRQPESMYARGMLMLEAGRIQDAAVQLRQLMDDFSGHHLATASEIAVRSLTSSL